jgi:cob(I)alamin adenosyltransferase
MTIVTRTGDKGTTGMVGGGRVSKTHPRMHAEGTIDELNSLLGLCLAESNIPTDLQLILSRLQHRLFTLGADIATPADTNAATKRITDVHVAELEGIIEKIEPTLPALMNFILPGGTTLAARLHHARTVCRRAERWIVGLAESDTVNPQAMIFINRMSDLLFILAREANKQAGQEERKVEYA